MKTADRKSHAGHTLLELIACVPAMTLLLMGMASTIHLARQAIPDGKNGTSAAITGASALDQIAYELAFATSISARSATDITFVTPDRSGDNLPETIRYWRNGGGNGPLRREVNGNPDEDIVPSAGGTIFTYEIRVDPVTSAQYCRAIHVRLADSAVGALPVEGRVETFNEPVLP